MQNFSNVMLMHTHVIKSNKKDTKMLKKDPENIFPKMLKLLLLLSSFQYHLWMSYFLSKSNWMNYIVYLPPSKLLKPFYAIKGEKYTASEFFFSQGCIKKQNQQLFSRQAYCYKK